MQNQQVFVKKRKFPTILFIALCFLIGSIFGGAGIVAPADEMPVTVRIVLCAIGVIFLLGLFWGISEFFYSRAGIAVSKEGFMDQSTRMACGFVPWTNVKKIAITTHGSHCYGTLILEDHKAVIAQSPGIFSRYINTICYYLGGSPIKINMHGYHMKEDDLIRLLNFAFNRENGIEFD